MRLEKTILKQLYHSYFSSNVTRTIKSRSIIWEGGVKRREEERIAYMFMVVNKE